MNDDAIRKAHFEQQKAKDRLGDAPVEAEYHALMTAISRVIDEVFNGPAKGNDQQVGFVLMVFPFGDKSGRCNYMSNGADRRDIVTRMKEMIARFEGQPGVTSAKSGVKSGRHRIADPGSQEPGASDGRGGRSCNSRPSRLTSAKQG